MNELELALSAALGIALAAATGFRVFVPLLIASAAAHLGYISPGTGFDWLATTPALLMLAVAAVIEILAYYIPGLDNLLDTLATPAAVVAGITVSAAAMTDMPSMLKWTLAIIAGGGAAAATQGATSFVRAHSTVLTAGLGNPVIATGELFGAIGLSVLALAAPVLALLAAALLMLFVLRKIRKFRRRALDGQSATEPQPGRNAKLP